MQPGKTSVTSLFSQPFQYVIPVFQRGYVWTLEKQVAPLWTDLSDRANAVMERKALEENPVSAQHLGILRKHFLGSLVLTPVANTFGRVSAYEVIDGQQRTTTLHLLLVAFRDVAASLDDEVLFKSLENLIRNPGPYKENTDHHKIWPTQAGREEIVFIDSAGKADVISSQYPVKIGKAKQDRPLLVQTYLYLYLAISAYLRGIDLDDPISADSDRTYSDELIRRIRNDNVVADFASEYPVNIDHSQILFMALQDHVQIMTLTLEGEDDPQVIFETLNARGEPLLASDLVRNFIFLEATRKVLPVSELYAKFWQDFDEQLNSSLKVTSNRYWREKERQGRITYPRIDLFFFHYTVLRRVSETKVSHVFQNFKDWWTKEQRDLEVELARIQKVSRWFREFISPTGEGRVAEFARLVKALDVSTLIPVYLKLRELYSTADSGFLQAIGDLESYVVRRAVCGYTTKNYNKIFLRLLDVVSSAADPAHALRKHLGKLGGHSQCWPTNQEFRDAWLSRPVYKDMRVGKVCAILRVLELNSHTTKQEAVSIPGSLSVEHVLPQGWLTSGHWSIDDMTDSQRIERDRLLHTFGNLTLLTQALNSSVSNGPFHSYSDKNGNLVEGKRRRICANSLLKMNSYFQPLSSNEWNEESIAKRAESLFDNGKSNGATYSWSFPVPQAQPESLVPVSTEANVSVIAGKNEGSSLQGPEKAPEMSVNTEALERAFHRAMTHIYEEARKYGYTPSYFLRMISDHGALETARQLISADKTSDGFTRMWEMKRLDLTVEALVLKDEWSQLFTADLKARAEHRLRSVGYL